MSRVCPNCRLRHDGTGPLCSTCDRQSAWKPVEPTFHIWARLAAPFDPCEVKTRPQGRLELRYVTARTVMNRLDNVLGPENWWDQYLALEHSVLCTLTIRLPDGSTVSKQDAGGYAGMTDQGDDDKSGYSDAFKRAAVKFGVGRYLYRDGVPSFASPTPVQGDEPPKPKRIRDGKWLLDAAKKRQCLPWFTSFGHEHGYPGRVVDWSPVMVSQAVAARKAINSNGASS